MQVTKYNLQLYFFGCSERSRYQRSNLLLYEDTKIFTSFNLKSSSSNCCLWNRLWSNFLVQTILDQVDKIKGINHIRPDGPNVLICVSDCEMVCLIFIVLLNMHILCSIYYIHEKCTIQLFFNKKRKTLLIHPRCLE